MLYFAMLIIAIAAAGMLGYRLFCLLTFYMRAITTPPAV